MAGADSTCDIFPVFLALSQILHGLQFMAFQSYVCTIVAENIIERSIRCLSRKGLCENNRGRGFQMA